MSRRENTGIDSMYVHPRIGQYMEKAHENLKSRVIGLFYRYHLNMSHKSQDFSYRLPFIGVSNEPGLCMR